MAQGRMIKTRISKSDKFAKLKSNKARLLYLMIYPHLDIEGRIDANPRLLRGLCVPLLNYSLKKVGDYLQDMSKVGLIKLYAVDGQEYIEFTKFKDFQQLRPDKEAPSHCPTPVPIRAKDGTKTGELNETELNETKHTGKTPTRQMMAIFTTIYKEFRDGSPVIDGGKDGRICKTLYKQCLADSPKDPMGLWEKRIRTLMTEKELTTLGGIKAFWNTGAPKKKGKTWIDQ